MKGQSQKGIFYRVSRNVGFRLLAVAELTILILSAEFSGVAHAQIGASNTWYVTVVMPQKLVAGRPATLAVLGSDGRLAPNVTVTIGNGQNLKTDATGRAFFTAPVSPGILFAEASGVSAVALVEALPSAAAGNGNQELAVAPVISLKDRFSICGGEFRGDADANRVTMNGDRALVAAASPECLVVIPSPRAIPGAAKLTVDSGGEQQNATTTLVSLQFEAPQPAPVPGQKSTLTVHVEGSDAPLDITVQNETPGVLEFLKGERQELRTSGGSRNIAQMEIEAIRSGEYSFNAKMVPTPDVSMAESYLRAAVTLAPKALQHRVDAAANRLATHPKDRQKIRQDLTKMISTTIAGHFRVLLEAARESI